MDDASPEEIAEWLRIFKERESARNSFAKKQYDGYFADYEKKKERAKRALLRDFYGGNHIPANIEMTRSRLVSMLETRIYTCIENGDPPWRFEELAKFASLFEESKSFPSRNKEMTLAEYFGMEEFLREEE